MKAKDGILNIIEELNGREIEPERLAKLNREQRAIVLKREEKRKERAKLIKVARESNDPEVHQHIFDSLLEIDDDCCEHGRSVWGGCHACDEIDAILYPELFCAECGVPFSVVSSEEEKKDHKPGDICPDCAFEKK